MATNLLLASALVAPLSLAALALSRPASFFEKLRTRLGGRAEVALVEAPVVHRNAGWTMVHCDDPQAFGEWLGYDEEGLPFRPGEEGSLGSHLLIELFDCDKSTLEVETVVGKTMRDAAIVSKATVVDESFHEFKPYGVSGAVIIQESHYTIHTWPEHGYAAVDLFYCGGTVHVHRAVELLRERFKPGRMKFLVVRRGVESEFGPNAGQS